VYLYARGSEGVQEGPFPLLDFEIGNFLITFLARKRFEGEKSNFTTFGPPGKLFLIVSRIIHYRPSLEKILPTPVLVYVAKS